MALIVNQTVQKKKEINKYADDELGWLVSAIGACLDNTSDDNIYFQSGKKHANYTDAVLLRYLIDMYTPY